MANVAIVTFLGSPGESFCYGALGMEERPKEVARFLWNEEPEPVVDSATRGEINKVVAHAAAYPLD